MRTSKNSGRNKQPRYPTGVLFPDTTLDAAGMRGLLNHFERVILCRPWSMGPVELEGISPSCWDVCHPPEDLKPEQDVNRIISEYQTWMNQHQGKGHMAFLDTHPTEPATWEIRQALRERNPTDRTRVTENAAFTWHLILHLAALFEQSRSEADQMLRRLQTRGSPLEAALEDPGDLPGPLADVSLTDTPLWVNDRHMHRIFEAWLGLFGNQIPVHGNLVTLHPRVFEYASAILDRAEDMGRPDDGKLGPRIEAIPKDSLPFLEFPVITEQDKPQVDPVLRGLSGRTLFLIEPGPDRTWS